MTNSKPDTISHCAFFVCLNYRSDKCFCFTVKFYKDHLSVREDLPYRFHQLHPVTYPLNDWSKQYWLLFLLTKIIKKKTNIQLFSLLLHNTLLIQYSYVKYHFKTFSYQFPFVFIHKSTVYWIYPPNSKSFIFSLINWYVMTKTSQ